MGDGRRPAHGNATGETVRTGGAYAADASADLTPGMMVGEYRIEAEIGCGGMGRVYAAVHPVIAKKAAIKVLHPELSVNRDAVERFVQEARSVNQIGHPNIVDIFSLGVMPDGRQYFAMEWLRGESLGDRMRKGLLPLADAMAILETIALTLGAVHDVGIVHRDLKPDNVFLVETKLGSQVKLLDFGIAKLLGPDASSSRTNTGNLIGTPAYMSPEQARGQGVDHRTDIYALGAMTFEMLTGELVFPAHSAADMVAKHLFEQPRALRSLNPTAPPALEMLVAQMLAKAPDERPGLAAARAVFSAHRGLAHAPTVALPATPRRSTSARRWLIVGGLTVGVAAAAIGVAYTMRDSGSARAPDPSMNTSAPAPAPPPTQAPTNMPPAPVPAPSAAPLPSETPVTAPTTPPPSRTSAETPTSKTKPKPKRHRPTSPKSAPNPANDSAQPFDPDAPMQ